LIFGSSSRALFYLKTKTLLEGTKEKTYKAQDLLFAEFSYLAYPREQSHVTQGASVVYLD
jgi:hypothetical protein